MASAILLSYMLLAVGMTWPLALHLRTHLLGDPTGDTGVYVWNVWIFRHEILRHAHLPFSTQHIFGFTGGADFALHNYAPLAGLVGAALIAPLGLVGTFNTLMIAAIAASGCGAFVLARHLGLSRGAAWAAGALFMAAPCLTARQTAHFSLVLAAPLPLFLWALLRTIDSMKARDAILVGIFCAAATYCDAYYGIYCGVMGIAVLFVHFVSVETCPSASSFRRLIAIDALIGLISLAIAWQILTDPTDIVLAGVTIGLDTLYTPMLALSGLIVVRAWMVHRPVVRIDDPDGRLRPLARLGGVAVTVALSLLAPVLVGIALRIWTGRLPATEIFWRSSPRGVDLLSYLVPNPNHPLFGDVTRPWLLPDRPDAFPEFVGSFSLVALLVIAVAAWRRALPWGWTAFTGFFAWLSFGPFLHVGGINTYIPGPWTFLRYLPVIGMARSPSRFAIVAALGISLLFGFAVHAWLRRPRSFVTGQLAMGLMAASLAFELVAAPRHLYSAAVPEVYKLIATTNDEDGRLLDLPTGVRDGTTSIGDFNASSQYFQTTHRRKLIGGYLSRVSNRRRDEDLQSPVLRALFALGEGRDVSPDWRNAAADSRNAFLARSCVRYVIVNKRRTTATLRRFVVEALRLTSIHEDADYELLVPDDPPPCR